MDRETLEALEGRRVRITLAAGVVDGTVDQVEPDRDRLQLDMGKRNPLGVKPWIRTDRIVAVRAR